MPFKLNKFDFCTNFIAAFAPFRLFERLNFIEEKKSKTFHSTNNNEVNFKLESSDQQLPVGRYVTEKY